MLSCEVTSHRSPVGQDERCREYPPDIPGGRRAGGHLLRAISEFLHSPTRSCVENKDWISLADRRTTRLPLIPFEHEPSAVVTAIDIFSSSSVDRSP
jgi:hypothetical protein